MEQFLQFLKVQKIIDDLYWREFPPPTDEENRYLYDTDENKQEFIDFCVQRFKFCDKIKPKNTNIKELTQTDIYRIQIAEAIRYMKIVIIADLLKISVMNIKRVYKSNLFYI